MLSSQHTGGRELSRTSELGSRVRPGWSGSLPLMDRCLVPDSAMTHGRRGARDEGCLAFAAARDPLKLISSAGLLSSARKHRRKIFIPNQPLALFSPTPTA